MGEQQDMAETFQVVLVFSASSDVHLKVQIQP